MRLKKAFSFHRPHSLVDIIRSSLIWLIPRINILLTLQLPLVTKTEFLLTTSTNNKQMSDENEEKYQLAKYALLVDPILRSNIIKIVWQTVRRITAEILGVKGLTEIRRITLDRSPLLLLSNNCFFFSCQWHSPIYPPASVLARLFWKCKFILSFETVHKYP